MPMEWEREEIVLKQRGGKQTSQILLEGDIIAPDSKPDVKDVLTCHGRVHMGEVRVGDDRINLQGELQLNILYVSDKGENAVYAMNASLPIEDIIYMDGMEKDMEASVTSEIAHMDCQVINDRKLGVKAVINVTVTSSRTHKIEAVVPSEGGEVAFLEDQLTMEEVVAETRDRFTIKEEMTIPQSAAALGEILESELRLVNQEIRPMDGKVMLRSNLLVDILYNDDQGIPHTWSGKIPFSGHLEASGITPKTLVDVDLALAESNMKIGLDDDGEPRILDIDVSVEAKLAATDTTERDVVSDAYAPGKQTEVTKETFTYPVTVASGRNEFTIQEKIALEAGELPMLQAGRAWGELTLQNIIPEQDMVRVEGVFTVEILYFCKEDDPAVCIIKKGIPFNQTVEMKGVMPGDEVSVQASIESSDFQILSEREGEIYASILLQLEAVREETAQLVTDIQVLDMQEGQRHIAGAIIYTVQPGDSLWSIAKRYDTTIPRILMVNDIENPDRIYPGQKLLIVKMIC